ncbi:hypothetical protein GOBAR_AA06865 [Gossypium barbadense]|uniref:Aminotransferase-like plant mobile domain-containing protein n=1 Tax=Gossypium barbadense TaxID=3634 RepID=A0A2P5YDN7_GOSBA|nr:hypothetical protein GOBAR_AA06865 [Gossypium barbadense]
MYILIADKNHGSSYAGLPEQLEDIRLLLDQCLKAKFKWMSYVEPDIIECIQPKFLAIRSMWDTKPIWSTCTGLESLASHTYYQWRREVDNFIRRGRDERPNIGQNEVSRRYHIMHHCSTLLLPLPQHSTPHVATDVDANDEPDVTYIPSSIVTLMSSSMPISMPKLMSMYLGFTASYSYTQIVS